MNHILFHDKAFGSSGFIAEAVIRLLCQDFRVGRLCSLKEPPAVCSLCHGGQVIENCGIVVIADCYCRGLARIFDDEEIIAAVICRVFTRIDDHCDTVALVHRHTVYGEISCHYDVGARCEVLFFENCAVLHQQDSDAIRP